MNELADFLEGLVDTHGLVTVVGALAEVCGEKAEHLRTNWQDETTAAAWEKAAEALSAATERVAPLNLP